MRYFAEGQIVRRLRPGAFGCMLTAWAVVACGAPDAREEERSSPAAAPRPASTVDTIRLEGAPEPIRLSLFRTPEDFPVPFSAYVPEGLAPEVLESDSGGAVRFVAELGGVRNEMALLHMLIHPPGTTAGEAVPAARAFAASRGVPVSQGEGDEEPERPPRFEWSLAEYPFDAPAASGGPLVGVIAVGRHEDRFFHVLLQYPPEYGDGFPARAGLILETLRWEETGEGLRAAGDSLR